MTIRVPLLLPVVLFAGLGFARSAAAVSNCSDIATQNMTTPLYAAGSSAALPIVARMGQQFALEAGGTDSPVAPTTLFYQPEGSCAGLQALVDDMGSMSTCDGPPCLTGYAYYYLSGSTSPQICALDANGDHVELVLSDVDAQACATGPVGPSFLDTIGPAVSMNLVTPTPQPEVLAITSEQAYFVFGYQCGGGISPWTDSDFHFIREPTSGTAVILQQAIGLPADAMHGIYPASFAETQISGSDAVAAELSSASSSASKTIGFLASSFADPQRRSSTNLAGLLSNLAFRPMAGTSAYYPDSTASSFDKQNVRDGHYPAFGYLHMITRSGQNGLPQPLSAKFFIDVIEETKQFSNGFDPFAATAAAGYIPQCAMSVERVTDVLSPDGYPQLQSYEDPAPCNCAFETAADPQHSTPASCLQCTTDANCSTGSNNFCRRGFCEAR